MAAGAGRSGVIDEFDFYEATFEQSLGGAPLGVVQPDGAADALDERPPPPARSRAALTPLQRAREQAADRARRQRLRDDEATRAADNAARALRRREERAAARERRGAEPAESSVDELLEYQVKYVSKECVEISASASSLLVAPKPLSELPSGAENRSPVARTAQHFKQRVMAEILQQDAVGLEAVAALKTVEFLHAWERGYDEHDRWSDALAQRALRELHDKMEAAAAKPLVAARHVHEHCGTCLHGKLGVTGCRLCAPWAHDVDAT